MQPMDVCLAGAVVFLGQSMPPDWFTADKFAMGVCIYLLFRMEKTIKDLTEAVLSLKGRRKK